MACYSDTSTTASAARRRQPQPQPCSRAALRAGHATPRGTQRTTASTPQAKALLVAAAICAVAWSAPASARVTLYQDDDFQGQSFSTNRQVRNFVNIGFNDRASSIVVTDGRWEVCDDVGFAGACRVLRVGSYPSLRAMGMNDRVSSLRPLRAGARVADDRYGPEAPANPAWRRRAGEPLFEAPVSEVRAIMGAADQRCWMERQDVVVENKPRNNVPGALLGALLGGVIGHQIGGGTGRDIATVGGAVAGGVVGSRVGPDGRTVESREVQKCRSVQSSATPAFWDVAYSFRGQAHHAQLKQPPGATITVNGQGEPRE
jgi:uncharacterized protein YcfJ